MIKRIFFFALIFLSISAYSNNFKNRYGILLNESTFLGKIGSIKATYAYGVGFSYNFSEKFSITYLMSLMEVETGFYTTNYSPVAGGPPRTSNYKINYFIPVLEGSYKLISNNKLELNIGLGVQLQYQYKSIFYLIENSMLSVFKYDHWFLKYGYSKLFISGVYKPINHFEVSINPFYLKNLNQIKYNYTNYGVDLRIHYIF